MNLVETQIVSPALQQCELGATRQRAGQRFGKPWQIPIDQLALQRDGRCRYDDRLVGGDRARDRGNQVREGFPGTRAGLDGEVFAAFEGMCHRLGHLDLAGAFCTAECGDRRCQQFGDVSGLARDYSW
ncbi:hypothetical protein MGAD_55690 [Mycolicibacterium gadium]|uniref:Uncharacterized protein n=1 Tax=Mycolicibacterium gadium TaxID=1794 RepID=A0A7I7WUL8_MYCGU|nr:hypothetical protein MGAD_55690 [Mycolicibacterium gadium]